MGLVRAGESLHAPGKKFVEMSLTLGGCVVQGPRGEGRRRQIT